MGSVFDSWNSVDGAYYMGVGTSWEVIWVLVAIAMCIAALISGSKHELDAYKEAENNGKQ